jgi:hypothetical protein
MAVTVKNAVFYDVASCESCKNGCFGRTCRLHHHGEENQRARNNVSNKTLLVTAHVVSASLVFFTLKLEVICLPKLLFFQEPHGGTSQKTAFIICIAL